MEKKSGRLLAGARGVLCALAPPAWLCAWQQAGGTLWPVPAGQEPGEAVRRRRYERKEPPAVLL